VTEPRQPWVLETRNLRRCYGEHVVVEGLNLTVGKGDIYGFLGPNGAGKTTTMRMILGLIARDAGEVLVFGSADPIKARARIGGIVEGPRFYPYLSGRENLRIFAAYSGGCEEQRLDELLELVRLRERCLDRVSTYSLGMRQRLGIAQALLNAPDLLLLDEPSNGLDPKGIREMRELILRLRDENGLTVFVSSHVLSELDRLCNRIGILQDGRKVAEGPTAELLRDGEDLESAFLRITAQVEGAQIK
tara:strand:- start:1342 stop:2082 length:741 start_codon:yes stop_codon:yes gene_type:complete